MPRGGRAGVGVTPKSLVSGSVSVIRRVVAAAVEDVGDIWANRRAARHIGRMTVDLGRRRGETVARRPSSTVDHSSGSSSESGADGAGARDTGATS